MPAGTVPSAIVPGVEDFALSRIHVQHRRRAGQADADEIVPAVAGEVIDPGEEVVRVPIAILRHRRINFATDFELRPLPPVRAMYDVGLAIAIQVAGIRPFGEIRVRELLPLERVQLVVLSLIALD